MRPETRPPRPPPALLGLVASACVGLASAQAPVSGFNGTAYLKTRNTVLLAGQSQGLARAAQQALVDQCNGFRHLVYHLAPVAPAESVMASLDVSVHEKYIDTDKALTDITGTALVLTDMRRWVDALKASATGSYPAVPPDCAQAEVLERHTGTLWRDGLVYELRHDTHKAIGRRAPRARPALVTPSEFLDLAAGRELNQGCREVVGGAGFAPGSHACVWDLFPYVAYLNWPFALSGRVQFGPTPAMFETIEPLEARHGHSIAASVFEIPPGFVVTRP